MSTSLDLLYTPLTPERVHFCPGGPLWGFTQNAAFCCNLRLRPHHALSNARSPPSGCIPRNRQCSWAHDRVLHFANCCHSLYTSPTVRTRPPGGGSPAPGNHTPLPRDRLQERVTAGEALCATANRAQAETLRVLERRLRGWIRARPSRSAPAPERTEPAARPRRTPLWHRGRQACTTPDVSPVKSPCRGLSRGHPARTLESAGQPCVPRAPAR